MGVRNLAVGRSRGVMFMREGVETQERVRPAWSGGVNEGKQELANERTGAGDRWTPKLSAGKSVRSRWPSPTVSLAAKRKPVYICTTSMPPDASAPV